MRQYEEGEYGLSEAIAQANEQHRRVKIRDKHILELVKDVNRLQTQCTDVEAENISLRYNSLNIK